MKVQARKISMKFRKVPDENAPSSPPTMSRFPKLEARKMFGCPVWFLNGNMVVGAHQETIFLRLSEADQKEILKNEAVTHFMPMPGRVMQEYVVLPLAIYQSAEKFVPWLMKAINYVAKLPAKEKKPKQKNLPQINADKSLGHTQDKHGSKSLRETIRLQSRHSVYSAYKTRHHVVKPLLLMLFLALNRANHAY